MLDRLAAVRGGFLRRVSVDADALFECWSEKEPKSLAVLTRIKDISHGLAGAAGIFGYPHLGNAAASVEEAVIVWQSGKGTCREVERSLERLLTGLGMSCFHQIEHIRRPADA
jgi:HPt (histidine-containing phosphotransfer) domain-containing protein